LLQGWDINPRPSYTLRDAMEMCDGNPTIYFTKIVISKREKGSFLKKELIPKEL